MESLKSTELHKKKSGPRHYHTITIPVKTSSGSLLLSLEIRVLTPQNQLTTCCSAHQANRVTCLSPLRGQDRSNTWPLTSKIMLERARYCSCRKTSLHIAVKNGQIDKVDKLLARGASLGDKDTFGKVALHYAQKLEACDSRRVLDLFWLRIVESGYKDDELYEATGLTAIHVACLRDDHWAASQLLKRDSSLISSKTQAKCPRWPGYSALHFAVRYGSHELLDLLLESPNSDANVQDSHGLSPAHLACVRANTASFRQLVARGADPYARSHRLLTPLRLAIQSKSRALIGQVLEHSKENPMDNKGLTPLHYCCAKGLYEKVISFLEAGIDPDTRVHNFAPRMPGYTCLHIAVQCKDVELMRLLLDNFADAEQSNSEVMTVVEMVCWKVKDLAARKEMIEVLKDYQYEMLEPKSYFHDEFYGVFDAAYEASNEPVVMEFEPSLEGLYDKILAKLAYKKCVAMTRRQMHSMFLKYGGNESRFVKLVARKDGKSFEPRLVYRRFDRSELQSTWKSDEEPIYHYYVVNLEALRTLITFGCDLSGDIDKMRFDYNNLNNQTFPGEMVHCFLHHQEIRRLVGLVGRHGAYFQHQAQKLRRKDEKFDKDFAELPRLVSREMASMRRLDLGASTGTLLDLFRSQHKLSFFLIRKPQFVDWLDTPEFARKLPKLVGILRMQCHKALARSWLLEPAKAKFREIVERGLGLSWLDDCTDLVLPHLSNEDLQRLAAV